MNFTHEYLLKYRAHLLASQSRTGSPIYVHHKLSVIQTFLNFSVDIDISNLHLMS